MRRLQGVDGALRRGRLLQAIVSGEHAATCSVGVAQVVPAVAGIVLLAFIVIHTAPGDPVLALAGEHGDAALLRVHPRQSSASIEPLPRAVRRVRKPSSCTAIFGLSYVHGRPVVDVVGERLPATLLLMTTALALSSRVAWRSGCWPPAGPTEPPIFVAADRRAPGPRDAVVLAGAGRRLTLGVGTGLFPGPGPHRRAPVVDGRAIRLTSFIIWRCPRSCWRPVSWR